MAPKLFRTIKTHHPLPPHFSLQGATRTSWDSGSPVLERESDPGSSPGVWLSHCLHENTASPARPGLSGQPGLGLPHPFCRRNPRSPLLITSCSSFVFSFCTTLFRCLDHQVLLKKSYHKMLVDSLSCSQKHSKVTSQQVLTLLSLSLSRVITALLPKGKTPDSAQKGLTVHAQLEAGASWGRLDW